MNKLDNNTGAFFTLLRAGLWEQEASLLPFSCVDFNIVYRLAQEQAIVGLVAAGLEFVKDVKAPKEIALQFAGDTLQLEQRNMAMNYFIGSIVEKLRNADIYTLLVKGQGIAQCYERPLWRACGDVDFLLSEDNYKKAVVFLRPLATQVEDEIIETSHLAMVIDSWEVELHGSLRSGLGYKIDNTLDQVQESVFSSGDVRSWMSGNTKVFLPGINADVFFVFTHIIQHFFKGGIGLRQICDWCRLIWTYRDSLDLRTLEKRLKTSGLMSEWHAFASLAVESLGMPAEAMPFYSPAKCLRKKAKRILSYILETGNFGHNKETKNYSKNSSYFIRKLISLWGHTKDDIKLFCIFPIDSMRVWSRMITKGIYYAMKGV